MTQQKADRRVERSKRALVKALIEVMIEKGYEAATIADIAERADVGRSTFYAHFADKEDLLRESLQSLKHHLDQAGEGSRREGVHPALTFSLPMLEHVSQVTHLFRAIVSRRSVALDLVHAMLSELVDERLELAPLTAEVPKALAREHIVGSFLSICAWWMNDASSLTAAQVDAGFLRLMATATGGDGASLVA